MGHFKPLEFHRLSSYPKRQKYPLSGQTKTLCRPLGQTPQAILFQKPTEQTFYTELTFYCVGFVRGLRLGPCGGTLTGREGGGWAAKVSPG